MLIPACGQLLVAPATTLVCLFVLFRGHGVLSVHLAAIGLLVHLHPIFLFSFSRTRKCARL